MLQCPNRLVTLDYRGGQRKRVVPRSVPLPLNDRPQFSGGEKAREERYTCKKERKAKAKNKKKRHKEIRETEKERKETGEKG